MSSKYNHQTSFKVEAFYKGLEELEAELDPKQIEKLIIFLEVIRTQEKFSKVLPPPCCVGNFNDVRYNICSDSSQIVQFISNSLSTDTSVALTVRKIWQFAATCWTQGHFLVGWQYRFHV